jgi:hypothetical protein
MKMPKQNPYVIPNENYKKTEIVQELKNKVPSYEEFLKTYEGNANYADLDVDDVGNLKSYGPCSYSPYEVNSHKVAGKHINMCGSLDCSYYRRIVGNRAGTALGTAASVGAGVGFWAALFATPFTGGASLAVAAGLSTAASLSAVGGTTLTLTGATETLNGVESELKLK